MLARNVEEYNIVRQEMSSLKDCITKYIGFVFAGSGVLIFGLASVGGIHNTTNQCQNTAAQATAASVAIVSAVFSVLVSLILFFLFYKFHSHNRYAGFCMLLSHEQDYSNTGNSGPLFSWETSICLLRRIESGCLDPLALLSGVEIRGVSEAELRSALKKLFWVNGHQPEVDKYRTLRGSWIVLKTLFLGRIRTDSWKFPPIVACMFLFMVVVFYLAFILKALQANCFGNNRFYVFIFFISLLQLGIWRYVCARLHSLMNGSTTIMSFYLKFVLLRAKFLNDQDQRIIPTYDGIKDDVKWKPCNAV